MGKKTLPHLHVACALIELGGRILAAQRSRTMSMPLKWEFPGGKLDAGESPETCLKREITEEMGIEIAIGRALPPSTHCYPDFTITLYPFVCTITSGEPSLNEHRAIAWLLPEELPALNWTEADAPIIESYRRSPADHPIASP